MNNSGCNQNYQSKIINNRTNFEILRNDRYGKTNKIYTRAW